jgi:hypothetical protein
VKVELVSLARLIPYEKNPRINDGAVDAVMRSIQEFGWRVPIVCDDQMVIICGHTRWKAATQLGLEKVLVHVAKDLTPAQIKAYRIADNQTSTLAEWDATLLPLELHDLEALDFDLSLLGFDEDDLSKWLGADVQEGLCDPDDVPEPPAPWGCVDGELCKRLLPQVVTCDLRSSIKAATEVGLDRAVGTIARGTGRSVRTPAA